MNKIALYIPSMNGGGAERVMLALANGLAEKDIQVDLLLNRVDGPYLKDASKKVNIVNLNTSRTLRSILPLAKYLRTERPNAILSAMNYVNIVTVMAKLISNSDTKVIVSEHINLTESNKSSSTITHHILKLLMSYTYNKADKIVAVSNGVAESLIHEINIEANKLTTIYNPIFSEDLVRRSDEPVSHPWLNENALPLVLAVGRLTHQKDFATLIHAFKKVLKNKACNLIILGEGELRCELEKLIKDLNLQDNVQLPGFVNNPYAWMSKADLFVLSSIYEGFGNVLVEAMACGTPVVSTDCPSGPSEILENGRWGSLVPTNDPDSLAEAILKALNNTKFKSELVKKRAEDFSVDNSLSGYIAVFAP